MMCWRECLTSRNNRSRGGHLLFSLGANANGNLLSSEMIRQGCTAFCLGKVLQFNINWVEADICLLPAAIANANNELHIACKGIYFIVVLHDKDVVGELYIDVDKTCHTNPRRGAEQMRRDH